MKNGNLKPSNLRRPGNGFKRRGQARGGPPSHKSAIARAQELELITERGRRAWQLFVGGATFNQIGKELGVSGKTAYYDCISVKKAMPLVLGIEGLELLKARALDRIQAMILTHWPNRGKKPSADVIKGMLEREAAMLGLDAPKTPQGFTADEVARILSGISVDIRQIVTDATMLRAIHVALQRRSGLLASAETPPEAPVVSEPNVLPAEEPSTP